MMLEIIYNYETVEKQIKHDLEDLEAFFKDFDLYPEEEKQQINEKQYKYRVVSIASKLKLLKDQNKFKEVKSLERLLKLSNKYDDFDPRRWYGCFKRAEKTKVVEIKINKYLMNILQTLNKEDSDDARFVLFNAIKYLAGKLDQIDAYDKKAIYLNKKIEDFTQLEEILAQEFDVIELPYEPNMIVDPIYKNGNFIGRMNRTEFEVYYLFKIEQKVIDKCIEFFKNNFKNNASYLEEFYIKNLASEIIDKNINKNLSYYITFDALQIYNKSSKGVIKLKDERDPRAISIAPFIINYLIYKIPIIGRTVLTIKKIKDYEENYKENGARLFTFDSIEIEECGIGALYGSELAAKHAINIKKAGIRSLRNAQLNAHIIKIEECEKGALYSSELNATEIEIGECKEGALSDFYDGSLEEKFTKIDAKHVINIKKAGICSLRNAQLNAHIIKIEECGMGALCGSELNATEIEIGECKEGALERCIITAQKIKIREAHKLSLKYVQFFANEIEIEKCEMIKEIKGTLYGSSLRTNKLIINGKKADEKELSLRGIVVLQNF